MTYLTTYKKPSTFFANSNKEHNSKYAVYQDSLVYSLIQKSSERMRIFLTIVIFSFISIHSLAQNSRLRKTAKNFHYQVAQNNYSLKEYQDKVSVFIDSTANIDSLVYDYYEHWQEARTKTSFPDKVKIKKIKKDASDIATITIYCTWVDLDLGRFLYVSQSVWYRRDGQWFRSGIPEKEISAKKLK